MNAHLNIYKAYTKQSREGHQLEDDLTRALAIALQENDIFAHQFVKYILEQKEYIYENLFDNYNEKSPIEIDIQKSVKDITNFDHLFAVRISGDAMGNDFFDQNHEREYNPITDMYIHIHNVVIIFEIKPRNINSTAQLYNQAYNILGIAEDMASKVTPVDFNWPLLMQTAVRVNNFQEAVGKPSRLLDNFISYIKMHNYQWLPQLPLSALSYDPRDGSIVKRISDAIDNSENHHLGNRLGIKCGFGWAQEILINLNENPQEIEFKIYPGNTKGQGWSIFKNKGEPKFKTEVKVNGALRELRKRYHIKFSGQGYFTGLWAEETDFKKLLHTKENFIKHSGRKERNTDWLEVESLLDASFNADYEWKKKCDWDNKVIGSNRSRFDISFGYEMSFSIPYSELQILDTDKNNLQPLIQLIDEVKDEFSVIID